MISKDKILATRFINFSKYLAIIAITAFICFLVINAINTDNDILFWICYGLMMIALIGGLQSVCLLFLGKYYSRKSK